MTSKIKVNILADGGDNSIITSDGAGSFTASSGLASSVQSVGGINNTPSFLAYFTGSQNLSYNVDTKVPYNTEVFDAGSCYDNSTNYRFTPTTAGKYYIFHEVGYGRDTSNVFNAGKVYIYKNGSRIAFQQFSLSYNQNYMMQSVSTILDMNGSSDYVEAYINVAVASGTARIDAGQDYCRFGGFKLIGA